MRFQSILCRALMVLGIVLLFDSMHYPVHAQNGCVTFGQARKLGFFARFNLRPAAQVKNRVEARIGGKVVSFLVCRTGSGPIYQLTVVTPNGSVQNIRVPAQ